MNIPKHKRVSGKIEVIAANISADFKALIKPITAAHIKRWQEGKRLPDGVGLFPTKTGSCNWNWTAIEDWVALYCRKGGAMAIGGPGEGGCEDQNWRTLREKNQALLGGLELENYRRETDPDKRWVLRDESQAGMERLVSFLSQKFWKRLEHVFPARVADILRSRMDASALDAAMKEIYAMAAEEVDTVQQEVEAEMKGPTVAENATVENNVDESDAKSLEKVRVLA
jgi:hypothetical protein